MGTVSLLLDLTFLLGASILSFVLYPFWIDFVYKFNMGESVRKDGPKTHIRKEGTPTMGGLIFVFTVALISFIFNRSRTQTLFPLFVATLAGFLGILEDFTKVYRKSGLPGFLDYYFGKIFKKRLHSRNRFFSGFIKFFDSLGSSDESGIASYQKIIFQFFIAGFVSYWTYFKLGWDYLWLPLLGNVHIGFLYPIFIFLFFIAILNCVAFTDGLDGLAGGLSLISFISFWLLSSVLGYSSLASFCATFVGAIIPFLYFNVFPARIFMGNVGSHVLGATLAVLSVVLHREFAFLFIGALFLIDGFSSPIQQVVYKVTGKRLFRMAPLHHHFELLGWHESKITFRSILLGVLSAFLGIFVALM